MRDQLIEILEDIRPDVDYDTCTTLVDDRIIDSLGMVSLIAEIEEELDVAIPAVEVVAENFNSVDALCALVQRLIEEDED